MCGAVGDDAYGSVMVSELQKYGIDTTGISVEEDTKTGVAVIIVEAATGENRIILSAEANHSVQPERFMELEIPLPDLLIIQLEIPLPTVLQILKVAKKQGVEVLLNAVPAIQLPNEVYGMVTHLVVNESEAIILSGCKDEDLERVEGLENVAKKFRKLGVKNVIITLGEKGVFYSGPGGEGMEKALDVKVVDTTAAGDTFVGAYALEAVKVDFDIKGAIKNATKAAAKTVERKGAQYSIPWSNEL
jgi:ribokinase